MHEINLLSLHYSSRKNYFSREVLSANFFILSNNSYFFGEVLSANFFFILSNNRVPIKARKLTEHCGEFYYSVQKKNLSWKIYYLTKKEK
mgnify:CR=1 FL=1